MGVTAINVLPIVTLEAFKKPTPVNVSKVEPLVSARVSNVPSGKRLIGEVMKLKTGGSRKLKEQLNVEVDVTVAVMV